MTELREFDDKQRKAIDRFNAKQAAIKRVTQAEATSTPTKVYLNDLGTFMKSHPSARIIAAAPWPVIEIA